jgi:type VI secretion system protein ImpB
MIMAGNRTAGSGQKFITRNNAPRVQIEYDVEIYGAESKVQLPFVMGVLADLAGKQADPLPDLAERKFMEVDIDNFDERMESLQPRVAFQVPNTLTEDGLLQVDLRFERLDDFSPAQVAGKIDALARLLAARTELANLLTYMDGKSGAEELVAQIMRTPDALKVLAGLAPQPPLPIEQLSEAGKQGE